jgi:hypothetical protein
MKYPKLDDVTSRFGAPMGRPDTIPDDRNEPIKFSLYRMPIVDSAYDSGGAYWGMDSQKFGFMYHAYGDGPRDSGEMFIRAPSREEAKKKVIDIFPNAKFFR